MNTKSYFYPNNYWFSSCMMCNMMKDFLSFSILFCLLIFPSESITYLILITITRLKYNQPDNFYCGWIKDHIWCTCWKWTSCIKPWFHGKGRSLDQWPEHWPILGIIPHLRWESFTNMVTYECCFLYIFNIIVLIFILYSLQTTTVSSMK